MYLAILVMIVAQMFLVFCRLTCIDCAILPSKVNGSSTEEIPSKQEATTASTRRAQGRIIKFAFMISGDFMKVFQSIFDCFSGFKPATTSIERH
jgi:hypothetical protein